MSDQLQLIVAAALVNNLVFVQLLGVSVFFTVNGRLGRAFELAFFTAVVMIVGLVCNKIAFDFILKPLGLEFLSLIVFLSVTTFLSSLLAVFSREIFPLSYRQHTTLFFFAGANSAIIGLSFANSLATLTLANILVSGFGSALGFAAVMLGFAAINLRLSTADIPNAFRGGAIFLVTAGIVAMSFLGFAGLV